MVRPPYTRPGVLVKVAGPEDAARPLAEALVGEFGGLREYLGIDALPMILVTYREDLGRVEVRTRRTVEGRRVCRARQLHLTRFRP
jgi:hypothetical protein